MEEEKNIKLTNIYLRIHHRKSLTMDDLAYLAKHNPVCFKMTCDKLLQRMPETKALVTPVEKTPAPEIKKGKTQELKRTPFEVIAEEKLRSEHVIRQVIRGLKNIENGGFDALQGINAAQVKELLGELLFENLFSNNVMPGYFEMLPEGSKSAFDVMI